METPLNVSINMGPVVAAIVGVMVQPHSAFLGKLLEEDRITQEELDQVLQQVVDRGENLAELVKQELAASGESHLADHVVWTD